MRDLSYLAFACCDDDGVAIFDTMFLGGFRMDLNPGVLSFLSEWLKPSV
jgi:hypothetical protein